MNDCSHADILRRVEKVEIDVAILGTKSNRLHQDVANVSTQIDTLQKKIEEAIDIARKNQTFIIAVPGVLGAIYTLIQILNIKL